jgi:D-3-phosphoglycerate dehydrogenase
MKILANDGLDPKGVTLLEDAGFEVITTKVAQEQLANFVFENQIEAILVRSATEVRSSLIRECPGLKLIGRAGVGLDNIDVSFARAQGIHVVNTPGASSASVAELVFAHLFGGVRFLHDSNRVMPLEGDQRFKQLKKAYGNGSELRGKTLGIIGFGRIGNAVAKMAIGLGMQVLYHDQQVDTATVRLSFYEGSTLEFQLHSSDFETVLRQSDFISLHVPSQEKPLISQKEFELMKPGVGIVNASRGGTIDEVALLKAMDQEKVAFAGLDVFESEPNPEVQILMHPKLSLTPHIGGSTREAQSRIGEELARQIIALLQPEK